MQFFNEFDIRTYGAERQPAGPLAATRCYKGAKAPVAPSYSTQVGDELAAKIQYAPQIYQTEATYDPQYAALSNSLLDTTLFGNDATSTTTATPGYAQAMADYQAALDKYNQSLSQRGNYQPGAKGAGTYGPGGSRSGAGISGFGPGNLGPNQPAPIPPGLSPTTTTNIPASRGIIGAANQAGTMQRQANITDWSQLSPAALDAIKTSNPQLAGLIDQMVSQSSQALGNGTSLSPAQMQQLQQSIRARQQGMLGGTGNAGTYAEALATSGAGQQLYQQRFQNAGTAAGISAGYYTPQLNNLMTQTYNPYAAISTGMQQNNTSGPRLFGSTINAQQANDTAFNAQMAAYNSNQNNNAGLLGAGISAVGSIGGAAVGSWLSPKPTSTFI